MYLSLASSPAWSISGRSPVKIEKGAPGPGQYNSISGLSKQACSIKGRGNPNAAKDRTNYPGPGTYNPSKRPLSAGSKFGSSKRNGYKPSDAPGPGTYDYSSKVKEGPSYSIKGKHKFKLDLDNPVRPK